MRLRHTLLGLRQSCRSLQLRLLWLPSSCDAVSQAVYSQSSHHTFEELFLLLSQCRAPKESLLMFANLQSRRDTHTDRSIAQVARRGQRRFDDFIASTSANMSNAHREIDVKNETNKDGSGKGQMAAWKVCIAQTARFERLASLDARYHRRAADMCAQIAGNEDCQGV